MSRLFGANDSLIRGSAILSGTPITMAAWISTSSPTTAGEIAAIYTNGTTNQRHRLATTATGAIMAQSTTTGSSQAQSSAVIADANWHHAAAVFASSTSRVAYLDGANAVSDSTSRGASGMNRTGVGRGTASAILGEIAHVAFWNVALSADEIAMLGAGKLSPLCVRPSALVCYLPYIGRDAAEIDIVGGGSFTLSGTSTTSNEPPLLWRKQTRRIYLPPSGTGTLAKTLQDVTASGAAKVDGTGALAKTLADVTASSSAALAGSGSVDKTLQNLTAASSATLAGAGTLDKTLGDVTAAGAATVAGSGSVAKTLQDLTGSSFAGSGTSGSLAQTLESLQLDAVAEVAGDVTPPEPPRPPNTGGHWSQGKRPRFTNFPPSRLPVPEPVTARVSATLEDVRCYAYGLVTTVRSRARARISLDGIKVASCAEADWRHVIAEDEEIISMLIGGT